jgi:catechol 2,3-dioxygenase-like lactoylglutathione lyase family enzyme
MSVLEIKPVYCVDNREENLNFFRDILGMKVLLEEGSMVELGGHQAKKTRILLDESPFASKDAGKDKKHKLTVLRANVHEIVALLEENKGLVKEFEGGEVGFEALSPEGMLFWLLPSHPYEEIDTTEFVGLSDFEVSELTLNVVSEQAALGSFASLLAIVDEDSPLINFNETTFEVPEISDSSEVTEISEFPVEVCDIEALEIHMSKDTDFVEMQKSYSQFETYLDPEKCLLDICLPEDVELWFEK